MVPAESMWNSSVRTAEDDFRGGRAADVAEADEEDMDAVTGGAHVTG